MRRFSLMAVLLICAVLESANPAPAQGPSLSQPSDFSSAFDQESNARIATAPLDLKNTQPSAASLSEALEGQEPDLGVLIASVSFAALLWLGRRRTKAAAKYRKSN